MTLYARPDTSLPFCAVTRVPGGYASRCNGRFEVAAEEPTETPQGDKCGACWRFVMDESIERRGHLAWMATLETEELRAIAKWWDERAEARRLDEPVPFAPGYRVVHPLPEPERVVEIEAEEPEEAGSIGEAFERLQVRRYE